MHHYIVLLFEAAIFLTSRCFEAFNFIKFFPQQVVSGNLCTPKMGKKIIVNWDIRNKSTANQSEKLQHDEPQLAGAFFAYLVA